MDLEVEAAAAAKEAVAAVVVVEAIVEVAATEDIMAAVENAEVVMEAVGHLHPTTEVVEAEADPAENIDPDLALIHHVSTLTLKRSLPRFLFHLLSFEYGVIIGQGFLFSRLFQHLRIFKASVNRLTFPSRSILILCIWVCVPNNSGGGHSISFKIPLIHLLRISPKSSVNKKVLSPPRCKDSFEKSTKVFKLQYFRGIIRSLHFLFRNFCV